MSTSQESTRTQQKDDSLLIILPASAESDSNILHRLVKAFSGIPITVAVPDASPDFIAEMGRRFDASALQIISYTPVVHSGSTWTLMAGEFLNAYQLSQSHAVSNLFLLGEEFDSLDGSGLRAMADEAIRTGCDLVTADYALPPRSRLVNSAILYPMSRALFGSSSRFPLPLDVCLSTRLMERLGMQAQRLTGSSQPNALLWPVAEAVAAGFSIGQVNLGARTFPQLSSADLTTMMTEVLGSLFAEIEAKASVWQRVRLAPAFQVAKASVPGSTASAEEIGKMIEAFRLAYGNLLEVWALVLPPQSLLGLKRLSATPAGSFSMPDSLWARIVYDFLIAYRLRTINRTHLFGAFTPLYLAWVASHLLQTREVDPERHIQLVAAAFEADKSYLVSRWRWPDRFNP